jgi:gliding motility-associated-like protein
VGSTFLGGVGMDGMNFNPREEIPGNLKRNYGDQNRGEINVDAAGNLYVASATLSADFPITSGAYQTTLGGAQDACVFKVNRNCSQLMYSTFLGGTKDDAGYSINLTGGGNLYVAGGTMSTDFPTTAAVLNPAYKGGMYDGFVALLNATGTSLLNSTYIGTTGNDQVYFVKLDDAGDVYITGQSTGNYPVINAAYSNPNSGQFIAKLDPTLSSTIYSTVFGSGGGKTSISPTAFLVDTCQNVYVAGWGNSANSFFTTGWGFEENRLQNVPITNDALQKTTDGNDFYFFVLAKNATNILYGSYFGTAGIDEHVDGGTSRFDKRGVMYQSMCGSCGGGLLTPTTAGTVSPNRPGANCNILGLKIEFNLGATSVAVNASPRATGCVPLTVQFTSVLYNVQNVLWDFRDGTFSSLTNPVHTFTDTGRYLVKLIGTDPNSCNVSDTAYVEVWVRDDSLEANFSPNIQIDCKQNQVAIASTGGNATTQYLWTLGDGSTATTQAITHAYASSGSYNVKLVMSDSTRCNLRDSFATQIFIPPTIDLAIVPNDTFGCPPLAVQFNNTTSYNFGDYTWYFGDGDSSTLRSPTHIYQTKGLYQAIVFWRDTNTCNKADTARFLIDVIDAAADASFVINRRFFNCDSVQVTAFSNYVGEDSELWIWGDGATSNTNPATHTYKGTTFDTLRHIIFDAKKQCHPIDTQFIIISLEPLETTINISDTLGCVPFTTSLTGVSPLTTTHYFWFFGDGDSASGTFVTHTFVDTGTYRILQVSIDSNACVNIDSNYATVVVIDDFVKAQFAVNTINDCDSDLYVQMVDQSINAVKYFWDFGDGTNSTLQNPDHHYYQPDSYTITLIVIDTTRCHPVDTLRRIVTLKPNAVADFTLADVCDGAAVKFNNSSTQVNATYSWSFGDNTFDTLTNPRHTYSTSGTYIVTLAIRDTASCNVVDTVAKPVIVYAQPIANFILERDTYKFEEEVYLQNTSINANTYNWSFGDGNTSTDFSPTYQYKKSIGWNQICLEAYILNAPCRDTICDSVYISFIPLIGVPNAFSPNGDGINDRVFVEGRGVVELEFRIFNRWGQQVYYSTDQKEGWDGVYKGERQELEVYTYLVRARFINDVRKELKGNITLLR